MASESYVVTCIYTSKHRLCKQIALFVCPVTQPTCTIMCQLTLLPLRNSLSPQLGHSIPFFFFFFFLSYSIHKNQTKIQMMEEVKWRNFYLFPTFKHSAILNVTLNTHFLPALMRIQKSCGQFPAVSSMWYLSQGKVLNCSVPYFILGIRGR